MYVYYAPLPASHNANRLSRLTVETDADGETYIDKESEKVILEVGTQRNVCCHSAGSVQFGDGRVLHLATGDNTSSSDNDGYSPHDERPGRSDYDAQKSSGNTNDLRGKILRVIPRTTTPATSTRPPGTASRTTSPRATCSARAAPTRPRSTRTPTRRRRGPRST